MSDFYYGNKYDLYNTTTLTEGRDLNDLIIPGRYGSSNAVAKTLLNCPTTNACLVEVISIGGWRSDGTYHYLFQSVREYFNAQKYYIRCVHNGDANSQYQYGAWYQVQLVAV